MKKSIDWIKANPMIGLSAVIALVALVWLVLVMGQGLFSLPLMGTPLTAEKEQSTQRFDEMHKLTHYPLAVPSDKPGVPPQNVPATVTQTVIDWKSKWNDELKSEFTIAAQTRRARAEPSLKLMLDDEDQLPPELDKPKSGMFPDKGASNGRLKDVLKAYRRKVNEIMDPPAGKADPLLSLKMGMPPSEEHVRAIAQLATDQWKAKNPNADQKSTEREAAQNKMIAEFLVYGARANEVKRQPGGGIVGQPGVVDGGNAAWPAFDKAKDILLYAVKTPMEAPVGTPGRVPQPGGTINRTGPNDSVLSFPFDLSMSASGSSTPTTPTMFDAYVYGQQVLWITRDIWQAIVMTNTENLPGTDHPPESVVDAPIKALLELKVDKNYTGIVFESAAPGIGPSGSPGQKAAAPPVMSLKPNEKAPLDFSLSPTGRKSNYLYDIRKATLRIIIEAKRIPQFFDNLGKVNFMTVLKAQFTDIDEYEYFRKGFVLGEADCVLLEVEIETLWWRDLTSSLMPEKVCEALGIDPKNRPVFSDK